MLSRTSEILFFFPRKISHLVFHLQRVSVTRADVPLDGPCEVACARWRLEHARAPRLKHKYSGDFYLATPCDSTVQYKTNS